ncbi:MAG: Lrp/AsnC family transcriptional regulator [Candidatus Sumerlaeota bacterium]|nr:Lrp/AsnC family transcriptional regulator [Candidatus Sumerlaeota bacterium]
MNPSNDKCSSRRILDLLRSEARLSNAEIAVRLGMTVEDVSSCIQKLEDDRIILGYRAVVNPENLGKDQVLSLIEVRVQPQRDVGFDEIAARIYRFPEVKTCYLLSGTYDLLLLVEGTNLRDVSTFVSEKLSTIDNVRGTVTHFMLKKFKEEGFTVLREEEPERLAVVP